MEYKNFGVSGAGNDQIFYHAVNEIVHNHNDIDTIRYWWSICGDIGFMVKILIQQIKTDIWTMVFI